MAFSGLMLTTSGQLLLAKSQQGKTLNFTRVAIGDGALGSGSMVNRTALISEKKSLLIDAKQIINENETAIITTLTNTNITEGFSFREIGIFAQDPDTLAEKLCYYDNAGSECEPIPDNASNTIINERLKFIIKIDNTANVTFDPSGNPIYLIFDDIDDSSIGTSILWSSSKISTLLEGVASLDGSGKVLSSQLPSYVDDVLEYANLAAFPAVGETGKIYVALNTNLTYRWSGSVYVEISQSIALGETSTTAYRGDRGKTAYDHSQMTSGAHGATSAATASTIVARDANARAQFADPSAAQDAVTLNYFNSNIYKIGDIASTTRNNLGSNYLLCNGALFDKETYPDLFSASSSMTSFWKSFDAISSDITAFGGVVEHAGTIVVTGKDSSGYLAVWYSTNGTTWTKQIVKNATGHVIKRTRYVNGNWVIATGLSANSVIYYTSSLGSAWTEKTVITGGVDAYAADICWTGTYYYISAYNCTYDGTYYTTKAVFGYSSTLNGSWTTGDLYSITDTLSNNNVSAFDCVWSGTYVYMLYYREYTPGNPGNHYFTYVARNTGASGTSFGTNVYTDLYVVYNKMSVANGHVFLSGANGQTGAASMLCDFSTTITTLSAFGDVIHDGTRYIVCGAYNSQTVMLYSLSAIFSAPTTQYLNTTTSTFYNMIYSQILGLYFMPKSVSANKLTVIADTELTGTRKQLPTVSSTGIFYYIRAL